MKGKKLLAGVLSAAMVLGTMALPAFADGEATTLPTADGNGVITLTENVTLNGSFEISDNLDLNGYSLTIDNVTSVIKSGTIKNGTIKVAQNANSSETMLRVGDYSHSSLEVKMENVTIDATEDYTAPCGLLGIYQESKLTLNGVTINVGSNDGVAVIYGNDQKADLVANKINIIAVNQNKLIYGVKDADIKNMTFKGKINKELFSVVGGKVENSTFTYTNAENETSRSIVSDAGLEKELTFINTKIENAPTFTKGAINNTNESSKVVADEHSAVNDTKMTGVNGIASAVAKIGDKYFATLDDAVAAAQDGDTITLLEDAEFEPATYDKNLTINGNNKKIIFNITSDYNKISENKTLTIQNADVEIKKIDNTEKCSGLFMVNGTLTFDDVNLTVDGYNDYAAFYNDGIININRSNFTIKNNSNKTNAFYADKAAAQLNITGSEILCDNTARAVINMTTTIKDSHFTAQNMVIAVNSAPFKVENSTIDIKNIENHGFTNGALSLKDSQMNVSGCGMRGINLVASNNKIDNSTIQVNKCNQGITIGAGKNVDVTNNSVIKVANSNKDIVLASDSAKINKDDNSTIIANIETQAVTGDIANAVSAVFEDATAADAEGEKVYDLYIEADAGTINRLSTAEFTFALTTSDDINYEVIGATNVTVTPDNAVAGKYGFNFDGVTAADKTGEKIKIGQIKFTGYGKFNFAIDAAADNAVHAAEKADNIVTDFIANPDSTKANEGKLTTDIAKLEDIEINKPLQKLTINIDFPNAVTDNANAYQKMFVEISGGDEGKIEYNLGNGTNEQAMNEGKYVITTNLTKNTTYTVTVKGEGYRTARYTVNMTKDKTLNFWNNVKDTAINVEEGATTEATKKNVTFLAGDIVKDGKINIYDLSAVVSYFGTNNLVSDHPEYAKYDLNRDGKIDSKDVAYVLVSWGK